MLAQQNPNRRANRVALAAAGMAGRVAGSAVRGAVNGLALRARNAAQRYFQGDVNQPATARTVQQVVQMRPVGARSRRRRAAGAVSVTEKGSLKLADITTSATAANITSGRAISSLPLQVETIGGRLFAMSKLYSRWRFISAILRYVPAVSSATDGGLVLFYTQEPDDVYVVGEPVGAGAAASAVDNMEFSVREKANMSLHLNPTLLYTTPGSSEQTWHSAGVVNVISNGSLATSKTYGSLYMDFVVMFTQPCAPFDVYAPLTFYGTPSGTGGNIFNWLADKATLTSDSGQQWIKEPSTGGYTQYSKFYLPPMSSVSISLWIADAGGTAVTIGPVSDAGVTNPLAHATSSTDNKIHAYHGIFTNTNPAVAGFQIVYSAGTAPGTTGMVLAQVGYTV